MKCWSLAVGALLLAAALLRAGMACAVPSYAEVRAAYTPSDAWLLARDGRPLASVRIDQRVRRLPWTRLEDVSPALLRALLVSEDRQFYAHAGVDWGALAASAWRNLWNTRTRGASTLTMQLVGLLDQMALDQAGALSGTPTRGNTGRRSVPQKISQTAAALWLEQHWKKDEILEAYLNLAGFRGEIVGVAAMSRGLFGKWPDGLDEREAALAAALLRAPAVEPSLAAARTCGVLREMAQMRHSTPPSCDGLAAYARLVLSGGLRDQAVDTGAAWLGEEQSPALAPHLARKLLRRPGERLRTTLDADLQRLASAALQEHLHDLARQNAEDGAVLVLDNASGEVLAWVGSSGRLSEAPQVDAVTALRQAGSTLKPFLYALAFERRELTAASLLDDSPLAVSTGNGLYVPQNYEPEFRGWVSARMALGGSLNVPAVRTLLRVGPDALRDRLRDAGYASLTESGDYYGYSLALGSADVSLLMQANAYRTLANGGVWSALRVLPAGAAARPPCSGGGCSGVFDGRPRRVYAAAPVFIVNDILADRAARVGTFGLESWLATPYWSAAKTGTSKDMRDNWCIGYSARYTVAVWVGNAGGEAMHDVSGVSGAAPVWRDVMDSLQRGHRQKHGPADTPPSGVGRQAVRFEPAGRVREAARSEWFVDGTGMSAVRLAMAPALAHIAYPGQGTIIALDPDIPPQNQRVALQLSGPPGPDWRWQMDGRALAEDARRAAVASNAVLWRPLPGKHRLRLVDGGGNEVDAVTFEVRALQGRRKQAAGR